MKSTKVTGTTKERKTVTATSKKEVYTGSLFERENYKWMLIGVAVMALGFLLMAGGRSEDPNVFNPKEIYSTVRITIAPIIILTGFIIEIVAIFRQPRTS